MATKDQIIITTKDGEVIPAIDPGPFGLAVAELEKLDIETQEVLKQARELPKKFEDRETYDKAAAMIAKKKAAVKVADSTMVPFVELLKKVKAFIEQRKLKVKNTGEQIVMVLEPPMIEWDERETRAAAAEQARIQADKEARLKREAEVQRLADEAAAEERKASRIAEIRADLKAGNIGLRESKKLLAEAGAEEEAALVQAKIDEDEAKIQAEITASKLKVRPNIGGAPGVRRHTIYKAECIDQELFKSALMIAWEKKDFQTHGRLLAVMQVSDQLLSEKAREIEDDEKMEALYPFVKASHQKKV